MPASPKTPKRDRKASSFDPSVSKSPYTFIGRSSEPAYVFRNDTTPSPSSTTWFFDREINEEQYLADAAADRSRLEASVEVTCMKSKRDVCNAEVIDLTFDDEDEEVLREATGSPLRSVDLTYNPPVYGTHPLGEKTGWTQEQERAMWIANVSTVQDWLT
jgi:hypothetical protein